MAYIVYLICCAVHGAMMSHLNVSLWQWEYWVSFATVMVAWICGIKYEDKLKK